MLNPNRWWKLVFSCRILRVVFDVRWSNKRNGMNFVMWGDCITSQGPFRRCCRGINKEESHKGRLVFSVLARMLPPPPSSHPSFYSHFSSPSLPPTPSTFLKGFYVINMQQSGTYFYYPRSLSAVHRVCRLDLVEKSSTSFFHFRTMLFSNLPKSVESGKTPMNRFNSSVLTQKFLQVNGNFKIFFN